MNFQSVLQVLRILENCPQSFRIFDTQLSIEKTLITSIACLHILEIKLLQMPKIINFVLDSPTFFQFLFYILVCYDLFYRLIFQIPTINWFIISFLVIFIIVKLFLSRVFIVVIDKRRAFAEVSYVRLAFILRWPTKFLS